MAAFSIHTTCHTSLSYQISIDVTVARGWANHHHRSVRFASSFASDHRGVPFTRQFPRRSAAPEADEIRKRGTTLCPCQGQLDRWTVVAFPWNTHPLPDVNVLCERFPSKNNIHSIHGAMTIRAAVTMATKHPAPGRRPSGPRVSSAARACQRYACCCRCFYCWHSEASPLFGGSPI